MLIWFGGEPGQGSNLVKSIDSPLFARSAVEWYRDTGAVWPLAGPGITSDGMDLAEALARYDRLQRAKVKVECGDEAGPPFPGFLDEWKRVSIPSAWDRAADVFGGWMNYGDLVWSFGYCSLFYDWPYSMLLQYLRLENREFLDVAEDMARHRCDIDQFHQGEGRSEWQRYEKGEHGYNERAAGNIGGKWLDSGQPSHTWNRGLLLYWALRGDKRALDAAVANGQAYYDFFYGARKLAEVKKLEYNEFRTPGWAIENWLALYEYTGERKYLDWANEIFTKTLLAMEHDNGEAGHIVKGGHQSAQFVGYIVEPVCRLHHLMARDAPQTGRPDAARFLRRVLDWQWRKGTVGGDDKGGQYRPVMWIENWELADESGKVPETGLGNSYDFPMADGYAYLYAVFGRKKDQELARQLFKEAMFYYGMDFQVDPKARVPLGYHYQGRPFGMTAKLHAWSGRYCQLYLQLEETAGRAKQEDSKSAESRRK